MDLAGLPVRVPTSMVAQLLGFSVRTLQRRRKIGALNLNPVDRGRELLFARADVLRVLGAEATPQDGAPAKSLLNLDGVRRRGEEGRRRRKSKSPSDAR